jgi:hypothetical protein
MCRDHLRVVAPGADALADRSQYKPRRGERDLRGCNSASASITCGEISNREQTLRRRHRVRREKNGTRLAAQDGPTGSSVSRADSGEFGDGFRREMDPGLRPAVKVPDGALS